MEEVQTQLSAGAVASAGFAAGVIAGEALQQEADISAEQTQIRESSAAAFAAGLAAGEAMDFEQEADTATEQTQVTAGGGALAAGAAGPGAGGTLGGGKEFCGRGAKPRRAQERVLARVWLELGWVCWGLRKWRARVRVRLLAVLSLVARLAGDVAGAAPCWSQSSWSSCWRSSAAASSSSRAASPRPRLR